MLTLLQLLVGIIELKMSPKVCTVHSPKVSIWLSCHHVHCHITEAVLREHQIIPAETNPRLQITQKKNYTNIKKHFSHPFSVRLEPLIVDDEGSSCLWCDTASTDIIPIYQCTLCYVLQDWNTDHLPCLLFPFSGVQFTVVFICVWT